MNANKLVAVAVNILREDLSEIGRDRVSRSYAYVLLKDYCRRNPTTRFSMYLSNINMQEQESLLDELEKIGVVKNYASV